MPENTDDPFPGFQSPRYTPTPDELFDELLAPGRLTDGELRLVLYIIRHTFGWKKDRDAISLSQITDGIVRKDGTRRDWGAGISRATAVRAVQGLERKGIIVAARKQSAERGNETTSYALHMAGDTLPQYHGDTRGVSSGNQGSLTMQPALVSPINPQETDSQETDPQDDSNHGPPQKTLRPRQDGPDPSAAVPASSARYSGPHSPYIAGVIFDHSAELGDSTHKAANSTQALRLWQASGRDEAAFVTLLHEARQRVRTYQGKQGTGQITNKMGYYFAVLADLCGPGPA